MLGMHGSQLLGREDFGRVNVVRLKTTRLQSEEVIQVIFDQILAWVNNFGRNNLVLNLAAAEFLPSMALGKMVMLNRRVKSANGRLALCNLTPLVEQDLDITKLTTIFNIYDTEEEALQSFL